MLLRHSFAYLFAKGVPGVVNFVSLVVFTRLVGPEEYGVFALALGTVTMLNATLFEWIRLGVLRYVPSDIAPRNVLLSTVSVTYMVVGAGLTVLLAVMVASGILANYRLNVVLLGHVLLLSYGWHEINLELARSELAPVRYGWLALGKQLTFLIGGGILAYAGMGGEGLLAGLAAGCMLPALLFAKRHWRGCSLALASKAVLLRLMGYGLPLTITFALGFILSMSDRLLIGWMIGAEAAGLYAVGYDLPRQSTGMLMMIITLAAYPITVRTLERAGIDAARAQMKRNIAMLMAIGLPATVGMVMLAKEIAHAVVGENFRGAAAEIIPWIALGAFLQGIKSYYLDHSFQLAGRTVGQVWVSLVAACCNILLNILLIPRYGIMAAAYNTVVAYVIAVILSYVLGKRVFPVPIPARELLMIAVATSVMAGVLSVMRFNAGTKGLIVKIVAGMAVYTVSVLIMNVHDCRTVIRRAVGNMMRSGYGKEVKELR